MTQFSVRDAKANLSRLIDAALAGEEVVITRRGVPVVRAVPVTPPGKRRFGALKGKIAINARSTSLWPTEANGTPEKLRQDA